MVFSVVPSHRRWFRFSLRTLLVLVIVLALPLAWIAKERRQSQREQEIAEQLRAVGFAEQLTIGSPYDTWEQFRQAKPQGWWRDLARRILGGRVLFLGSESVKDITPLSGLKNLLVLGLDNTQTRDTTPLAEHTKLQILSLGNTQVSDVSPLAGLTNLQELDLRQSKVSDISALSGLTNLRRLVLTGTAVSDLTPLLTLAKLTELDVIGTPVGKEQIEAIKKALPTCKVLHNPFPKAP